jgi:hypothetical protein
MVCRSDLGRAALELAAAGHPVLPLHSPEAGRCSCGDSHCSRVGKHPRGCYGLTHATTDPERIASWWWGQPEANVGLRCDGLLVFDVDGAKGQRSLADLEWDLGELPASRVQTSGRGEHRFYRIPAESSIGNSTAPLGNPPDLHLRAGSRGYVVAAPSLHASGTRYRWLEPNASIAELPQPWLERMVGLQRLPEREPSALLAGVLGLTGGRYGQAALEGELHKIRHAPEGARNETLNRSVFRLAQLAAGGELELEVVEHEAKAAAIAAGLSEREVDLTVHYALTAGYRFPRARKPR